MRAQQEDFKMLQALQTHKNNNDRAGFNKVLEAFLPQLKRYVANRLRHAVRKGWIPKGMYEPMDIVDEVYLAVFEQFSEADMAPDKLRVRLFQLAEQKLDEIISQEREHLRDLSIEELAAQELKTLEEHITADAEGEVVFVEELDDISYHLDDDKPKVWLLDEGFEEELLAVLDLPREILQDKAKRQILAQTYQNLPTLSRIVLELRTRGGLSVMEIAQVRGLSETQVQQLLDAVRARFRRALGL
jgi:RNA polymerase sigma factor (sigma-70 family)